MPDSGTRIRKDNGNARGLSSHPWLPPMRAPWPSAIPWWVMVCGVALGWGIGYTPHLLIAMAALCLLLGWLRGGVAES